MYFFVYLYLGGVMRSVELLLLFVLMLPCLVLAQASDLFISEYIEGSSNNKAVEIFNGTGASVDLTDYKIWLISNGGAWPETQINLTGTLANGNVFVLANSGASAAILAQADTTSGSANWNGDDAVGLAKNVDGTFQLIDAVGQDGDDPGTGWNVAGITNATLDHTLIRKRSITSPDTNWTLSAGTNSENSEWTVYAVDYVDNLGAHQFGDNTTVQFASSAATVNEGDVPYQLVVTITNPSSTAATTADVVLISGDAADIDNYLTVTVTFPAGSSANQTVTVTITDDTEQESTEIFTFKLQNVSGGNNASAGSPNQFQLSITDNDLVIPKIVINEIMKDPTAADDTKGEWIELYNNDVTDVDINGWKIKDDGSDSHVINNGGPLMIQAGGYLILGRNDTIAVNGGVTVDYKYTSFQLSNADDEVVLVYSDGITEVDRVNYDGGTTFPDPTGASMELKNHNRDNNVGSNWSEALTPYGAGDKGTPGAQNSTFVSILSNEIENVVHSFRLLGNFPNPFNPATTLVFDVPYTTTKVELTIYDLLGKKVRTLFNGSLTAGQHRQIWDGADLYGQPLPSGVYFALLSSEDVSSVHKLILLR